MTTEEALKIDPARYSVHGDVATALRVLADALREAQAQVAHLNAKLDQTHTNRCFNCEQTVTEATTARQASAVAQMREDAAKIVDLHDWRDSCRVMGRAPTLLEIANEIRALPAPAARTYDDGVRDAAKAVRSVETRIVHQRQEPITESDVLQIARDRSEACAAAVERLLSPAPAVAPVDDRCKALYPPTQGPRCGRPAGHDGAHDSGDGTGGPSVAWSDAVAPVAAPNPRVIVAPPIDFSEEDAPKPVAFDAEAALVAAREAARTGLDRNPTVEARQIAHLLRRMLSDALAAGRGAR